VFAAALSNPNIEGVSNMRKLLTGGIFVLGVVSLPVAMSPFQSKATPVPDYRNDSRLRSLRNFFHQGECPAEKLAEVFLEAADAYELDWRLLPSLSFIETTGGKAAHNNNMFGWDSGNAKFSSAAAGIHAVGYNLANSYLYRGKKLESLLATYNPNPEYVRAVKYVMRSIAPTE
jgi:hypothetical protein